MKKTLSVILSLVLIFSVINLGGITAFAENETITDGDYSYRLLDDGTYELLSYEGADTDLIIPSEFRGLPVTVLAYIPAACADINEDSTVDAFDMFYIDKAIYA